VHDGHDGGQRAIDPAADQGAARSARSADVLADPPVDAGQRQRDRRRDARPARAHARATQEPEGIARGQRILQPSVSPDVVVKFRSWRTSPPAPPHPPAPPRLHGRPTMSATPLNRSSERNRATTASGRSATIESERERFDRRRSQYDPEQSRTWLE